MHPSRLAQDPEGLNTAAWPVPPEHFITPVDAFFTRSHAPIPSLEADEWRLEVGGLVDRPHRFSLLELSRSFPRRTVTATLVCAGLRRQEFLSLGPLPGELPWGPEPVSTGEWTGYALADVLRAVGLHHDARHVEFVGLDGVERKGKRFGFGGSIDLSKALSDEVLLATHLNGAPLPREHGFPLRAVIPGWIGARSVKWLGQVRVRPDPSANYFQSQAYRVQREADSRNPQSVSAGMALTEVPLNSVILEPLPNQSVQAGDVWVRGWAMGSAARAITRVEVSPNGGEDWVEARVSLKESPWAWIFWEARLELRPGRCTLAVRATDSAGTVQPRSVAEVWNVKGYGNNAWHRVPIQVLG